MSWKRKAIDRELGRLRHERAIRRALQRSKKDTAHFIECFCHIEDRDVEGVIVPFRLWDSQREALKAFEQNRLTVVLKARQLGLTWLALCYAAKKMYCQEGYSVIALSRTENEAKELVRRMTVIFENMPELVSREGDGRRVLSGTTLSVELSGKAPSTFKAMPSTPSAGRSFTANLILLDEWAFQQYAHEIWTAAFPTINRPTGGQVIGLSTMARGTLFEEIYTGDSGFAKVFLPWNSDPRRDEAWYAATKRAMGEKVRQEYPATEEEAFSAMGGAFFPELDGRVHLCGMPPMEGVQRYVSIDYGLDALAALWIAVDGQNRAVVYRELYRSGLIVSEAAKAVKEASGGETIRAVFAPPDLWNRNRDTGRSTAEIFASVGLPLVKTSNARVAGWLDVKEWLKVYPTVDEQTGEPMQMARLRFVKGKTPELWRTMCAIRSEENDPNDAASTPHELTHLPDSLRAFCAGRPTAARTIKEEEDQIQQFLEYGG